MKNRIFILCTLLLIAINCFAQKKGYSYDEIGVFLGVGSYNGDINPNRPLYKVQPAIGLNVRHGINKLVGINFQAIHCTLKGDDKDFNNEYQQARGANFENELVELSLQAEFNFMELKQSAGQNRVSPFIAFGPGLTVGAFADEGLQFVIPMGIGVKFFANRKLTITAEWKYRKTFTDILDHIYEDQYETTYLNSLEAQKQKSFLGELDWYNFLGVAIGYRFGKNGKGTNCHAYRQ